MTSRWKDYIKTESELVDILKADIQETQKNRVIVIAGHLPLIYEDDGPGNRQVYADPTIWGMFSTYTFDVGAQLALYAREQGKNSSIALVVDDMCGLPLKDGKLQELNWMGAQRRSMYKSSVLPEEYEAIIQQHGLSPDDFVKQEGSGLYLISEKRLKAKAIREGHAATNECSLAYKGLVRDPALFDKEKDMLISFIPGQCKGNLCGMLDTEEGLEASHVFFPHAQDMGGVYSGIPEWNSLQEMLDDGKIIYRRDE